MPNSYKSVAYSTTGSGSNEDVYTCGVVASVVKSLVVYNSSSTTAYAITVKIYKAASTTSYEVNYQSVGARTAWNVLSPDGSINLQNGDKIQVVTSQAGLVVNLSYMESSVSVSGINLSAIADVSDVAATDNQVLTWDSATGLATWETPTGGVTNVTGTAPISVSGTTTKNVSISAATTGAAGSMSAADKLKLDGIAVGAEVNQNAFSTILAAGYAADGVTVVTANHAADAKEDSYTFTFAAPLTLAVSEDAISLGTTAEVNQNAFSNVAVSGQTTVTADSKTDTLTLVAGTGISITTDASTDSVTITNSSTGANAFGNVAVSGQTTVAADSNTDTVTFAVAGGMSITTDAATDTITFDSKQLDTDDVTLQGARLIDMNGETLTLQDSTFLHPVAVFTSDSVDLREVTIRAMDNGSAGYITLMEAVNNGTNGIRLQAPTNLATSPTFTLPSADGTSGQVLSTNGSGVLSFTTVSGGGGGSTVSVEDSEYTLTSLDGFGVYTVVSYYRDDNTLWKRSTLSAGTAPFYTTQTVQFYATDGTTITSTRTYTLTYTNGIVTNRQLV